MYDMHVHTSLSIGEDSVEDAASFARALGLEGIGIVQYYGTRIAELPASGIDLARVVMLKPRSAAELGKMAAKARSRCEVLMVHGGDYDVNRAACENAMVDVLAHPELGRKDSGMDHITMKAAADNSVAVEINFREVLETSRRQRIYILSAMRRNVMLAKKYGAPVIATSGAVSKWGMRGGRELASLAHLLGMDLGDAIRCASDVPKSIVTANREKLAGRRWEGVVVEE